MGAGIAQVCIFEGTARMQKLLITGDVLRA
jgi:hypothetical protein